MVVTAGHLQRYLTRDKGANSSGVEESDIEDTTIATIEMKASELITVFPKSVDSPQRSFDESILRALRQSGGSTCERNKALWIADSLKLKPFALLNDNQVEEIALTHCDNLMPLIAKSQDHSFRVKHVTAGKKRAWDNSLISTNANATMDIEANLMSIQHYGPYAQQLSKRCYKQLDINSCQLLNDDWTFLPQLRYICAQLLAGAIIMNKKNEAVLVNTVEIYGRQRSLDVHRESFVNKKGKSASSSLPPVTTKYYYTWATIMNDNEGDKLVVGTKTLNALITSSLRIDSIHEASVGGGIISHFELDESAALTASIFLDSDSIKKASSLASNQNVNKVDRFDLRYQLRQLRSKFQYPSTYLLCRASSIFANDLRSQPYSIFTLYEAPDTGRESAAKIASKLFLKIAETVQSNIHPTLPKTFVNTLLTKYQDGQVKSILQQIVELYHNENAIDILENHFLNEKLMSLANLMSTSLVLANKSVVENVKSRVLNGY
ncbi:uncharacterized protein ATC70_006129 [Mucor velutinosus]|uniref:Uncharacterized protein n=1 Tax=Mucor velutinosus TaxID=708070 RepID=A0AAN7DG35_9FUNG|nr:hypothetical protein ATC70_006129 [Mucor velutinosus]